MKPNFLVGGGRGTGGLQGWEDQVGLGGTWFSGNSGDGVVDGFDDVSGLFHSYGSMIL